jgi:hypothetical protein
MRSAHASDAMASTEVTFGTKRAPRLERTVILSRACVNSLDVRQQIGIGLSSATAAPLTPVIEATAILAALDTSRLRSAAFDGHE